MDFKIFTAGGRDGLDGILQSTGYLFQESLNRYGRPGDSGSGRWVCGIRIENAKCSQKQKHRQNQPAQTAVTAGTPSVFIPFSGHKV
jgi:hypothetical protein